MLRTTIITILLTMLFLPRAFAQDCSAIFCDSTDAQVLGGYDLFDQTNFDPVLDGFGNARNFVVHIPATYDAVDGVTEMVPLIFAFHGGNQGMDAMLDGKWADHFGDDVAYVIPLSGVDPCMADQGTRWMQPTVRQSTTDANPNCDAATQVSTAFGTMTYWNSSLSGSFADVAFVENLRAVLLARFPNLNPNKVYATGFSSGGGLTYTLACYRSSLFRGFSVVAEVLGDWPARGDYDQLGITDPQSLRATCGLASFDPNAATGILPQLWGADSLPIFGGILVQRRKPFALFAGDQDNPLADINDTGAFIRQRNNLNGTFWILDPFSDAQPDQATTQRRTFVWPLNAAATHATFRRFMVRGVAGVSGEHAMPDAQECGMGTSFMTCDYSYTDQTLLFFEQHADLSLVP